MTDKCIVYIQLLSSLNINTVFLGLGILMRLSYLYNGSSYIGRASLYWDGLQSSKEVFFTMDLMAKAMSPSSRKHDDVIKWKQFPHYWPFVRGIHRSPVNSPHKGQWRGALICTRINGWVNNGEAGDLRGYRAHYDVIMMAIFIGI